MQSLRKALAAIAFLCLTVVATSGAPLGSQSSHPSGAGYLGATPASISSLPAGSLGLQAPLGTSQVCFGDSITSGQGSEEYPGSQVGSWCSLTASWLCTACTPLNKGVPGTMLQHENVCDGSGVQASNGRDRVVADTTGTNKKDLVLDAYGFNDLRMNGGSAGTSQAKLQAQYQQTLTAQILGGYDPSKIVGIAPYQINDAGIAAPPASCSNTVRATYETGEALVFSVFQEYGVWAVRPYIDIPKATWNTCVGADNIHPKDACYLLINNDIKTAQNQTTVAAAAGLTRPTSVTPSSVGGGALVSTVVATGSPTNCIFEYILQGDTTFTWAGTTTQSCGSTKTWTGLSGSYYVRAREVFAGGNSPWFINNALSVSVNPFDLDTFTDTAGTLITAHTSDGGQTYAAAFGNTITTADAIDSSGRLYGQFTASGSNAAVYAASGTPGTTDYYCEVTLFKVSSVTADKPGCAMRIQAAANTYYYCSWDETAGGWKMFQVIAGTVSQNQGTQTATFSVSTSHVLRCLATGTTTVTGTMSVDGTVLLTHTFTTAIPLAGLSGPVFRTAQTSTTGIHIDKFTASP